MNVHARPQKPGFLYTNFLHDFPPTSIPFLKEKHPILTKLGAFYNNLPKYTQFMSFGLLCLYQISLKITPKGRHIYTYTMSMRDTPRRRILFFSLTRLHFFFQKTTTKIKNKKDKHHKATSPPHTPLPPYPRTILQMKGSPSPTERWIDIDYTDDQLCSIVLPGVVNREYMYIITVQSLPRPRRLLME